MTAFSIRADVLQALDDWRAGKPVRSIELGHTQKQEEHPGASPRILQDQHHPQDQVRAHAYCFAIIDTCRDVTHGAYEDFLKVCRVIAQEFDGLTDEERDGAESLAWKALLVGWKRATAGFAEHLQIDVQRPPDKPKALVAG